MDYQGRLNGDEDPEVEFQALLDELTTLTAQQDAALSTLTQLDTNLAALSSAIALTSSALNTPSGLLCMLRPISHLSTVIGTTTGGILMEVALRNESNLALTGNWIFSVAHLQPQRNSSIVHSTPLPVIPAGKSWTGTFALELSSTQSSTNNNPTSLALFLSFDATSTGSSQIDCETMPPLPSLALLHVFTLDAVHILLAGGSGSDGAPNTSTPTVSGLRGALGMWQDLRSRPSNHMVGLKIGAPKALFGINPETQPLVDTMMKLGNASQGHGALRLPPSNDPLNEALLFTTSRLATPPISGQNNKAVVQGMLPSSISGPQKRLAEVSMQPAQSTNLAAMALPYAELEVECSAGDVPGCLSLHEGILRRVQMLQNAVKESNKGARIAPNGILLPNGVLVPAACSVNAGLNSNALDEAASRIEGLTATALRIRDEAAGDGEVADEESLAAQLRELVVQTRELTAQLTMTL